VCVYIYIYIYTYTYIYIHTRVFQLQLLVIQFTIKTFHVGFMPVFIVFMYIVYVYVCTCSELLHISPNHVTIFRDVIYIYMYIFPFKVSREDIKQATLSVTNRFPLYIFLHSLTFLLYISVCTIYNV